MSSHPFDHPLASSKSGDGPSSDGPPPPVGQRTAGAAPPALPTASARTVEGPRRVPQRLGRRAVGRLRQECSPRDLAVLADIARFRLMTSRQLEALHFADLQSALTAARTNRRVLQRLLDQGLVHRLERRIGGLHAGSAAHIYTVTSAGDRVLHGSDSEGPKRSRREVGLPFVAHTLAIAELYTCLVETIRQMPGSELLSVQAEPVCWRRWTAYGGGSEVLRPDLYVSVGSGPDELRWFVEIDRGHEHLPTLRRKCVAYEGYYDAGVEQTRDGVFPRVLWVMDSERRVAALSDLIARDRGLTSELFAVTTAAEAVQRLLDG